MITQEKGGISGESESTAQSPSPGSCQEGGWKAFMAFILDRFDHGYLFDSCLNSKLEICQSRG